MHTISFLYYVIRKIETLTQVLVSHANNSPFYSLFQVPRQPEMRIEKNWAKTMWGLGRDRVVELVRIVFKNLIPVYIPAVGIPGYDWSIVTVYLINTYINYLTSQSTEWTNIFRACETPLHCSSWHFAILTREMVFQEVTG